MVDLKSFLTKQTFSEKIEQMVLDTDDLSYFEAVILFAEESDKSPEELIPYMSQVLLDKVRKSASDSGLIDYKEPSIDEFFE